MLLHKCLVNPVVVNLDNVWLSQAFVECLKKNHIDFRHLLNQVPGTAL